MKKILPLILALLCFAGVASAEANALSGMNYEELVALKDRINLAIWNSKEWQEVEVPKGVWVIGQDIPAGKWTIKAADGLTTMMEWGDVLDESGNGLSWSGRIYEMELLYSVNYEYYEKGKSTEVTWDLKDGQYFIVEYGIAVFSPYSGKQSLGFK